MLWRMVASSGLLILGGCVWDASPEPSAPPTPPPVVSSHTVDCEKIKLVEYSASMQKQGAAELKILSIESQVATFVVDYGQLRNKIREECKK